MWPTVSSGVMLPKPNLPSAPSPFFPSSPFPQFPATPNFPSVYFPSFSSILSHFFVSVSLRSLFISNKQHCMQGMAPDLRIIDREFELLTWTSQLTWTENRPTFNICNSSLVHITRTTKLIYTAVHRVRARLDFCTSWGSSAIKFLLF